MSTWEEASHCPKCGEAGEDVKQVPVPQGRSRGGYTHILYCRNERCKWFNTSWVVTVGPNGEIPEYKPGPKQFPFSPEMASYGRRTLEQLALVDPAAAQALRKLDEDGDS